MFPKILGFVAPRDFVDVDLVRLTGIFRPVFSVNGQLVVPQGQPGRPLAHQTIHGFMDIQLIGGKAIGTPTATGASIAKIGDPMLLVFKKPFSREESHVGNTFVLGPAMLNWLEEMADTNQLTGLHIKGLQTIWEVIRLVPTQKPPSAALANIVELLLAEGSQSRN